MPGLGVFAVAAVSYWAWQPDDIIRKPKSSFALWTVCLCGDGRDWVLLKMKTTAGRWLESQRSSWIGDDGDLEGVSKIGT